MSVIQVSMVGHPLSHGAIAATQGRSVTAMAAYEGQSGSKDRGDPEVCDEPSASFNR